MATFLTGAIVRQDQNTTRRGLLRGGAALAAVVPAVALRSEPDAELLRLCRRFYEQEAEMDAIPNYVWDELGDAAVEARENTVDLIEHMRPVTDRGRRAKASVAVTLLVEYGENANCIRFSLGLLRDMAAAGRV
jgi:hypothetical protein